MSEEILKPINVMTDDELLSVLTVKRENFNDEYKTTVADELANRGIDIEEKFSTAMFKFNLQEVDKVETIKAYEKISLLKTPLDVLNFINYMQENYIVQKNKSVFAVHHHSATNGFTSFFLDNEDKLKSSLQNFFALNSWLPEEIGVAEHWETFAESSSAEYILKLAQLMDESNINYCVNSAQNVRFNSFNSPYSIVVPVEEMSKAEGILEIMEEVKEGLHAKLEEAERQEDTHLQLELLTELESITPEDSIVFYNKAQLLDEKGDYQNASDALIESFNIEMSNGTVDDIEDIENYLVSILDKVESKSNILHCLATIYAFKGEVENSFEYYKKIISLDENDAMAHMQLGHHYYSYSEDDDKVKLHFNKYLELEPESEEREAIEEILKNL